MDNTTTQGQPVSGYREALRATRKRAKDLWADRERLASELKEAKAELAEAHEELHRVRSENGRGAA